MLGDFNAVLGPKLDRSSDSTISGFPLLFMQIKKDIGLVDVWRAIKGEVREYIFFHTDTSQEVPF